MKLFFPAFEGLIFQSQYFSNKSLISRTYTRDNIVKDTCFQKFHHRKLGCFPQSAVIIDLK